MARERDLREHRPLTREQLTAQGRDRDCSRACTVSKGKRRLTNDVDTRRGCWADAGHPSLAELLPFDLRPQQTVTVFRGTACGWSSLPITGTNQVG